MTDKTQSKSILISVNALKKLKNAKNTHYMKYGEVVSYSNLIETRFE